MNTFHAPAERSSSEVVDRQLQSLISNSYLMELVNALPYVVTILNDKRQIIFSNKVLLDALKVDDLRDFLGKRPGEALNCIHSRDEECGCGTSESCRYCGAVNAITTSIKENRKVVNECRIIAIENESEEYYDFEVTATPFSWQGERFTIFALADISGVKRKRMLERIFFHDILNTAGNLKGIAELASTMDNSPKKDELNKIISKLSDELVEDILEQRQLSSAENGDLQTTSALINTGDILEIVLEQFQSHIIKPVKFAISGDSQELSFSSDRNLLIRILKNMVKNAVEASDEGSTITVKSNLIGSSVRFTVHNSKVIPRDIQLQIFKRSFSTKGTDRGLGTYSMKLLGEKFLKGKVHFLSEEGIGTEFYFDLPI